MFITSLWNDLVEKKVSPNFRCPMKIANLISNYGGHAFLFISWSSLINQSTRSRKESSFTVGIASDLTLHYSAGVSV